MDRKDYNVKINSNIKPMGYSYDGEKSKQISDGFFGLMLALDHQSKKQRIHLVIERAKRNFEWFDHLNPAKEESTTTVFRLVEEILKKV